MLEKAKNLATRAHATQRYGSRPYTDHLDDVVKILEPYGETAKTLGYLHDVLEDTDVGVPAILEQFGSFIADCVAILTDEPGPNRKARKKRTYEKMAQVQGEKSVALVVKAADRLANVNACIADEKQDMLRVYVTEHDAFRSAVYRKGLCDEIWDRLERAIGYEL